MAALSVTSDCSRNSWRHGSREDHCRILKWLESDADKAYMPKTIERSPSPLGLTVLLNEELYSSQNIRMSTYIVVDLFRSLTYFHA
jgi:hypothetical protein